MLPGYSHLAIFLLPTSTKTASATTSPDPVKQRRDNPKHFELVKTQAWQYLFLVSESHPSLLILLIATGLHGLQAQRDLTDLILW